MAWPCIEADGISQAPCAVGRFHPCSWPEASMYTLERVSGSLSRFPIVQCRESRA